MSASPDSSASPGELEQWLAAARQGSRDALGKALDACRQYLLLLANENLDPALRGKVGASDLVQETFLEAQRDFDHFRGTSGEELFGWLRQILLHNLANVARHYHGTDKRQVSREVALADTPLGELVDPVAVHKDNPGTAAIAQEQRQALQQALAQLPERMRQVVHWRNYERLPFEEIGQRLGCTADTARKTWARAVEQLQQMLQESSDASG